MTCGFPDCRCWEVEGAPWCRAAFPYTHHGPAINGDKLTDYLISEANMREAGLLPPPPAEGEKG